MTWRWIVGFIFAATAVAASQTRTGAIVGKVTDQAGGSIPGVTIIATFNGDRRAATTSVSGEYRLDQLGPGLYRLEARLAGFVTEVAERVDIDAGRTAEWNPVLRIQTGRNSDPVVELRSFVQRFTGSAPADCGQHRLLRPFVTASAGELQQALTCASDAARQRKPFWTFKQDQGIDSAVFQGLLGTDDGAVYRFSYDSAPCGGPGCPDRFTIEPCERPIVLNNRGSGAGLGCQR